MVECIYNDEAVLFIAGVYADNDAAAAIYS